MLHRQDLTLQLLPDFDVLHESKQSLISSLLKAKQNKYLTSGTLFVRGTL